MTATSNTYSSGRRRALSGVLVFVVVSVFAAFLMWRGVTAGNSDEPVHSANSTDAAASTFAEQAGAFERVEARIFADPADVLEGEVELRDDMVGSRSSIVIYRAEKRYSGGGGGTEAVVLTNGAWAYSTYISGPFDLRVEPNGEGHDVRIDLPAPTWSGSPEAVTIPSDEMSYVSTRRKLVQAMGASHTNTQAAREELKQYIVGRVEENQTLFDSCSCAVSMKFEKLIDLMLTNAGLTGVSPKHTEPLMPGQFRVIIDMEQYRVPGSFDMQLPLTSERCEDLLSNTMIEQQGTASVPATEVTGVLNLDE